MLEPIVLDPGITNCSVNVSMLDHGLIVSAVCSSEVTRSRPTKLGYRGEGMSYNQLSAFSDVICTEHCNAVSFSLINKSKVPALFENIIIIED